MSNEFNLRETRGEISVEWKIKKFSSLPKDTNYSVKSPEFLLSDATWHLWIYPNGRKDCIGWISLFLHRECTSSEKHHVAFTLGFKKCDGLVYMSRDVDWDFDDNIKGYGVLKFLKISVLKSSKDVLTSDDGSLVVFCTARVCTGDLGHDKLIDTACQTESLENQEPSGSSIEILQTNFNDLFLSERHADVTINVQDHVFKVHRSILATRSPVFSCMFDHDTEEKATGIVNIADFNPTFFKDFLAFLYTGKLDIVSPVNAVDMYKAADKYDVKDLKSECVRCMEKELSSEIFCDVIDLASVYGESKLLKKTTEFFVENVKTILPTSKWQCLLEERSTLANELLIKMVNFSSKT